MTQQNPHESNERAEAHETNSGGGLYDFKPDGSLEVRNRAAETPSSPSSTATMAGVAAVAASAPAFRPMPGAPMGRRYGFLCQYCSSRLEATESMAAQSGTCPTCGNSIIIPILDNRGRLIDPTTNQVIKQDPHPVHAYAAAGHRAPQIVTLGDERAIECPRCQRRNPIASNNCAGCGLPFTMEGTVGESISTTNTWAVASLVLGIVGVPIFCIPIPPMLALIFGIIALRASGNVGNAQAGRGMAIAGIVLGAIGLIIATIFYTYYYSHL